MFLLYKVWGYHSKFVSMNSLGVYYRYVKMPRCGGVEHGLEYIKFYVQRHSTFGGLFVIPTGTRRAARGGRITETRLLNGWAQKFQMIFYNDNLKKWTRL